MKVQLVGKGILYGAEALELELIFSVLNDELRVLANTIVRFSERRKTERVSSNSI